MAPEEESAPAPHKAWGRPSPSVANEVMVTTEASQEDFSDLEYAGLPLWKKALMKKRAEEDKTQKMEHEQEVWFLQFIIQAYFLQA